MIRRLVVGMYTYMPLAQRALRKLEDIIRNEMDAIGGQEIDMSLVQPAGLWQETGRWEILEGKEKHLVKLAELNPQLYLS